MTGDQSLHQAALLVKGAELNLRKLLTEVEPLLREHVAKVQAEIAAIDNPTARDEAWDRIDDEGGWTMLCENLLSLGQLSEWAEDFASTISRQVEGEAA